MTLIRKAVVALAAVALSGSALAQAWPSKPIRVIVPFPAGGGTDIIARDVTQKVAAATGWVFVIDNRPGAGGNLGVDAVAKAPADGYTIVLGQTSNLAINPTLYASLPYNPQKDLAPIVLTASAPLVLVTGANTRYKTLADVVAAAKATPGALNFASPGNGTVAHLTGELFQKAAGVKFQHVPYKGAAQALTDVLGGNVELYMSSVPTMLGQIKQGKVRALAVTSAKRTADLPNVPTINESGFKGFDAQQWYGVVGPAGIPAGVVKELNDTLGTVLAAADLRDKLSVEAVEPNPMSPEQFGSFMRADIARWTRLAKERNIHLDS